MHHLRPGTGWSVHILRGQAAELVNTASKETTGRDRLPDLAIGDLRINPPIIQGGMGVRVSASRLVSAVSSEGALGVVASVGVGEEWSDRPLDFVTRSELGFREVVQDARKLTDNPIGVNIMCALTNYDSLARTACDQGIAAIISGAGLPLRLPSFVGDKSIKLIPIVSSARAASLVCRTWVRRYKRLPDAFVVEGPLAGGHLGFSLEQLEDAESYRLERLVTEVIELVAEYETTTGTKIPVIAAGGIFDGKDIARFLKLGAAGVQMATRFVCTHECDVAYPYKEAYLKCRKEDIVVIDSPVGLPARVIKNRFVERLLKGEKVNFGCPYRCLTTCNPAEAKYCIAQALVASYRGQMDQGYAMCGTNAYRCDKIVSVKELIDELVKEALEELHRQD